MLRDLKITNIAIIKEADIHFDTGLNVLTGETGAGKSIIIDSINAILGERTSRELIRTGSNFAEVSAFFENISNETSVLLTNLGLKNESDGTLLLFRKITSDGKNTCRVNGETVTVSMLKQIGQSLINVHGQMDNHNLLNPEQHYTYIDSFAENTDLRLSYNKCFEEYLEARKKYNSIIIDEGEKARKIDLLSFQINEIEEAALRPGERDELEKRKKVLQNAETLIELLNTASVLINGDDNSSGAGDMISSAADMLSRAASFDESFAKISETMTDISYTVVDCASEIRDFLYSFDIDPTELNDIEERLDTIYRLSKKYGENEDDILEFLENAKSELEKITFSDQLRLQYETEMNGKKDELIKAASLLSDSRRKAGDAFIDAVTNELAFLDMQSLTFKIVQNSKEFDETGADEIYFLISANAGEAPKPLSKIASGGELSRIMLAIKNVLASKDNINTLIFDEIDTGVSGRAAQKIGIKLKEVSENRQVLCVTHLAQIAAFSDNHFLISKSERDNKTFTEVLPLDTNGKIRELARIMGGMETTRLSLDAAGEMLQNARKYFLDK